MLDVHFDLSYALPHPFVLGGTPALGKVMITNNSDEPVHGTFYIGPSDGSVSVFYSFEPSCAISISVCHFSTDPDLCMLIPTVAPGATHECSFKFNVKRFWPVSLQPPPGNYVFTTAMDAQGLNSQNGTTEVIERTISVGNGVVTLPMLNAVGVAALFVLLALVGLKAIKSRSFKSMA